MSSSYRSGPSPSIRTTSLRRAWRRSNRPSQRPAKPTPPRKHQPIGRRLLLRAETFATGLPGATARVVRPPTDRSEVRFGTSVTIVRNHGRQQTFRIVGEDEADPPQGSISCLAAGEIDVRKTRGRCRSRRLRRSRDYSNTVARPIALSSLAEGCKPVRSTLMATKL
jgi:hypothetical protein